MTRATNKCDADVCFGSAGNRCPRVRCELCSASFHAKCVNISSTQHKLLRDLPGACWLCMKCRDPENRKPSSNDVTGLILQRTTSSLNLMGVLVDSVKSLCRIYSKSSASSRSPTAQADDRSAGEIFQEFDLSNVFESMIGDKRQRSSSVSRSSTSPPDKIVKVDVPISNPITAPTTVSTFSDATQNSGVPHVTSETAAIAAVLAVTEQVAAEAIGQPTATNAVQNTTDGIPLQATSSTATLIATAERAAALAVEEANVRATQQAAAHAAQLATAQNAVHAAETSAIQIARQAAEQVAAQATAHATELAAAHAAALAAEQAAAQAIEQAATHAAKQAHAYQAAIHAAATCSGKQVTATNHTTTQAIDPVTPAAVRFADSAVEHATNPDQSLLNRPVVDEPMELAVAETPTAAAQPTLSVAPAEEQCKWFYVTRFKPHETVENIIRYIKREAKSDSSRIVCQKLVRQNIESRPPTFISFKVCVPEDIEAIVTSDEFWPAGVSIKPFLEERPRATLPTRSRSRATLRDPPRRTSVAKQPTSKRRTVPGQSQPQQSVLTKAPIPHQSVPMPFPPQYQQYHHQYPPFVPLYPHYQQPPQGYNPAIPRMQYQPPPTQMFNQ